MNLFCPATSHAQRQRGQIVEIPIPAYERRALFRRQAASQRLIDCAISLSSRTFSGVCRSGTQSSSSSSASSAWPPPRFARVRPRSMLRDRFRVILPKNARRTAGRAGPGGVPRAEPRVVDAFLAALAVAENMHGYAAAIGAVFPARLADCALVPPPEQGDDSLVLQFNNALSLKKPFHLL